MAKKGLVYKIVIADGSLDESECYIGSTTNLSRRKGQHKASCNIEGNPKYNRLVYSKIRECGGFDNWRFVVIEEVEGDKYELGRREDFWISSIKANLNCVRPALAPSGSAESIDMKNKTALETMRKKRADPVIGPILKERSSLWKLEHRDETNIRRNERREDTEYRTAELARDTISRKARINANPELDRALKDKYNENRRNAAPETKALNAERIRKDRAENPEKYRLADKERYEKNKAAIRERQRLSRLAKKAMI